MNNFQWKIVEQAYEQIELGEIEFTDFEIEFISDIYEKGQDYLLSEKQNTIVNKIGNKVL